MGMLCWTKEARIYSRFTLDSPFGKIVDSDCANSVLTPWIGGKSVLDGRKSYFWNNQLTI